MTVLLPDEHPPAADAPLDGSPSSSCRDITNTLSVSPPFGTGAAPSASPRVVMAYRLLVGLLGAIWLANGWFQFSAWVLRAGPAHPAPVPHPAVP
jgi:hypothetical protein